MLKLSPENIHIDIPTLNTFRIGDEVHVPATARVDETRGVIVGIELQNIGGTLQPSLTLLDDGGLSDGWQHTDLRLIASRNDAFDQLFVDALKEAEKAMLKYPQPTFPISKLAEESGEVIKEAIHCAEGRGDYHKLRGEIVQTIAMLVRLYIEGDQVHGLKPVRDETERQVPNFAS